MRKKIFIIVNILIVLAMPIAVHAKASSKANEDFANVVLFAHFAGNEAADDAKFFKDNRDEIIKLYNGSQGRSVTNYLKTISYGKFNLKNIFPQDNGKEIISYELPFSKEQAYKQSIDYSVIKEMISNIPDISNKIVDYNHDGYIDNLTIIIRGGDKDIASNSTYVCHKGDYYTDDIWSNKRIGTYNILNTYSLLEATVPNGSAVITHEFLHSLGYPDLYRNGSSNDHPVYTWDIMASANRYMSYPLAYLRSKFTNWIDIETITSSQTITLHKQDNGNGNQAYIIKSPLNEYEFFVVEFRKKPAYQIGDENSLDYGIGGSGVIVYRVDTTVTGLSNHYGQTGIYVFRPSVAPTGYDNNEIARVINAFLSSESGRTSIGSSDLTKTLKDGALTYSNGSNSGIVISEVSSSSKDEMTLKVTIPDATNFDLWKDTDYKDLIGGSENTNKEFDISVYHNIPYMVTYANKKLYTQVYENNIWKQLGTVQTITEANDISQLEMISINNDLYLFYSGWGYLKVKKWNQSTNSWNDVTGVNNCNGSFGISSNNGVVYATLINQDSNSARLISFDGNSFRDLGSYFSNDLCGQAEVASIHNQIYVSVRQSNGDKIRLYRYNASNSFTEITNSMSSNTYDMTALNDKLYFTLGVSSGSNLSLYTFDGSTWSTVNSNISYGFPKLVVSQGNLYVLATSTNTGGSTKVYSYDDSKKVFEQEGADVDTTAQKADLISIDDRLFVAVQNYIDNNIVVKEKGAVNSLLSLSITPPNKTTYKIGDRLDTNGLKVVANYVKNTKEILSSEYKITGFDTTRAGVYQATISFGGVSNIFSYEVVNQDTEHIQIKNGWITENGNRYYYINGVMSRGVTKIGNDYYFFGENSGKLFTTPVTALNGTVYLPELDGKLYTGWKTINNEKYYYEKGVMARGVTKIGSDYYFFGENSGKLFTTTVTALNGTVYHPNSDGKLYTGWKTINNEKYYYINGVMARGVTKIGSDYYFFGENSGKLFTKPVTALNGTVYHPNSDGKLYTGWKTINNEKYYYINGVMARGVTQIGSDYYFFGENSGKLFTTPVTALNGTVYYPNSDGKLYVK